MKIVSGLLSILLLLCLNTYAQQGSDIDSLNKLLLLEKTDTGRVILLSELSFRLANKNPDTAMVYVLREKEIADKINVPKITANVFNDLAIVQDYKGDLKNALVNNLKALRIRKEIGDEALVLSSLNKIAVIYQELGNNDTAAAYQLEVLKLAEKLNKETMIGVTLGNLSALYMQTGKRGQAHDYLDRAITIAIKQKDTMHLATHYTARDVMFEHEGNIDSALVYAIKAAGLYKSINALSELAQSYNSIGYLLGSGKKKYKEALPYLREAFQSAAIVGNKIDMAYYATTLADDFLELKMPDSCFYYFRLALRVYEPGFNLDILQYAYSGLADYYMFVNKRDSAVKYNRLYRKTVDSIYSISSLKQINELQARFETEKKEQQIIVLNKQNTINQLSISHKNILIGLVAGSFVIALILGGLFYNRYRMRQDARLQNEIMKQQRIASQSVLAAEEMERQRIAAELHDGIGQMFSAVKMNLSGIADRITIPDPGDRHLLDKTLSLVDESCKEVRVISHQMMPNVLLKAGLTSAIRDFIDKIDEHKLKITLETFGLHQPLESNIESVLYRIIQESVNNVIKHAGATTLDIQLHKDEDSITATIEDNGIGFDIAKLTDNQGIGLKSIKARVEFLNGKVDYDTTPGKGTLVAIYIPIGA